jgi:hypothetical protein
MMVSSQITSYNYCRTLKEFPAYYMPTVFPTIAAVKHTTEHIIYLRPLF